MPQTTRRTLPLQSVLAVQAPCQDTAFVESNTWRRGERALHVVGACAPKCAPTACVEFSWTFCARCWCVRCRRRRGMNLRGCAKRGWDSKGDPPHPAAGLALARIGRPRASTARLYMCASGPDSATRRRAGRREAALYAGGPPFESQPRRWAVRFMPISAVRGLGAPALGLGAWHSRRFASAAARAPALSLAKPSSRRVPTASEACACASGRYTRPLF